MERWEKIEELGIDWFMIRWYLEKYDDIFLFTPIYISIFLKIKIKKFNLYFSTKSVYL